jgi:hypothetical protein
VNVMLVRDVERWAGQALRIMTDNELSSVSFGRSPQSTDSITPNQRVELLCAMYGQAVEG